MVIVDTSIWIDHFRSGDSELGRMLDDGDVLAHPWIIGELTLGGLSPSAIRLLDALPKGDVASHEELMHSIRSNGLANSGIGFVDAQLVTSTLLTPDATLWAREQGLAAVAERLEIVHHRSG